MKSRPQSAEQGRNYYALKTPSTFDALKIVRIVTQYNTTRAVWEVDQGNLSKGSDLKDAADLLQSVIDNYDKLESDSRMLLENLLNGWQWPDMVTLNVTRSRTAPALSVSFLEHLFMNFYLQRAFFAFRRINDFGRFRSSKAKRGRIHVLCVSLL